MKRALKIFFRALLGFLLILPLILVLLVRFTDGSISIGSFYLGYDEDEKVFEFEKNFKLKGIDGPYVIGDSVFRVTADSRIQREIRLQDSLLVSVKNPDQDSFTVVLRDHHSLSPAEYALPAKLIAISDIEGNFDAFSSFLQQNEVIDQQYNWVFGEGHLVLVGDFVDRGDNVIPTLWLIYKLEAEAEKSGGKVHFIIGNHEIMNIQGNFYYAKDRYKKLALEIGRLEDRIENYKRLFSAKSELGRWLRSKNTLEKIGSYMFVHAGLAPEILKFDLSLAKMNQIIRENIDQDLYKTPNSDSAANFLMGTKSPYWYRGLVMDYKYYDQITEQQLVDVLAGFSAKQVVIGHTVVKEVSKGFGGKVIRIDVKHGKEKFSEKTQGLFIEAGKAYVIDASGNKAVL